MDCSNLTQKEVEGHGVAFAKELFGGRRCYDTSHTRRPVFYQRLVGDFFVEVSDGVLVSVEVKTEREHTGNLFLETWSNLSPDERYRREGWLSTIQTEVLMYIFLDQEICYSIPFQSLYEWAIRDKNALEYPIRKARCDQKNETWGHLVPVRVLLDQVSGIQVRRRVNGKWVNCRERTTQEANTCPQS